MTWRMVPVVVLVGLVAAILIVANRPAPEAPNPPGPAPAVNPAPEVKVSKMIVKSATPVRWFSKLDIPTREALQSGRKRLAITINAYEPPEGVAILVVRMLKADGSKPVEIDHFSVHPNAPFKVSDGVEPQSFLISLVGKGNLLEESEVRLEVGFDSSHEDIKGGTAEVAIEIVDIGQSATQ